MTRLPTDPGFFEGLLRGEWFHKGEPGDDPYRDPYYVKTPRSLREWRYPSERQETLGDLQERQRLGNFLSSLLGGDLGDLFGKLTGTAGGLDTGKIDWTPEHWEGASTIPEGWTEGDPLVPRVSPEEVIKAQEPRIQQEMARNMGQVAAKLGGLGALPGGGYAKELGEAARKGTQDIGEIIARYRYGAAEKEAGREFEADQARRQRSLQEWMKRSGYEQEATQEDLERSLREWSKYGDWMLDKSSLNANLGLSRRQMMQPIVNQLFEYMLQGGV